MVHRSCRVRCGKILTKALILTCDCRVYIRTMVECGRGLRLRSPSEVACGGAAEHFEGSGPIRSNFTPTRPARP
jgi:hypothetical protein